MTKGDGRRALRVAELIRPRFAEAARRRLDDPKLAGLVVTRVEVSDDLSVVDIGVRFLGVDAVDERRRLVDRLRKALPVLRRTLLEGLDLRRVPTIRVHYDEGEDARSRVESLLHEIANDPKPKPE